MKTIGGKPIVTHTEYALLLDKLFYLRMQQQFTNQNNSEQIKKIEDKLKKL